MSIKLCGCKPVESEDAHTLKNAENGNDDREESDSEESRSKHRKRNGLSCPKHPYLRIKHLGSGVNKMAVSWWSSRQSQIVDMMQVVGALAGHRMSLEGACEFLNIPHEKGKLKISKNEHGKPLTARYVEYAYRDVTSTREVYVRGAERYRSYGLANTPLHSLYSSSSIGKALLNICDVTRPTEERFGLPAHYAGLGYSREESVSKVDLYSRLCGIACEAYHGGRTELARGRDRARLSAPIINRSTHHSSR